MKTLLKFMPLIFMLTLINCSKDDDNATDDENITTNDPIVGKWMLKEVNDTAVANVECYKDSYIESDAKVITFYILDRQEDGSCTSILQGQETLTIKDGFYFLGEDALDIYINSNTLTWRPNTEVKLVFQK